MRAVSSLGERVEPEVFHHLEQRGSDPWNKVNVTTYVFQTNKGVGGVHPKNSSTSTIRTLATTQKQSTVVRSKQSMRPPAPPIMMRSMTPQPQPTATYYSEERVPVRGKSYDRPSYLSPPQTSPKGYHGGYEGSPHGGRNGFMTVSGPAPPQYHFVPEDSIDDSHTLSVQQSKALFERRSWRDQIKPKVPGLHNGPSGHGTRYSGGYHRHTNRSMTSSAPPAPGRYEFRRARPSVLEWDRSGGGHDYDEHLVSSPSQGHTMSPVFKRIVPRESGPQANGNPAWYGSLRHSNSGGPHYNGKPSDAGYGSLPRPKPSRQAVTVHAQTLPRVLYTTGGADDYVFSPVRETSATQNHVQKIELPNYKTVVTQPFISAQSLKQSVTNAAAHHKQHSPPSGGGLLRTSGGVVSRAGMVVGGGGGTFPSSKHLDNSHGPNLYY